MWAFVHIVFLPCANMAFSEKISIVNTGHGSSSSWLKLSYSDYVTRLIWVHVPDQLIYLNVNFEAVYV